MFRYTETFDNVFISNHSFTLIFMQHLQPNTTLQSGKYKIEGVLGQGGFGITYMAEIVYTHKYVAIKCNIAHIGNSPQPPCGD